MVTSSPIYLESKYRYLGEILIYFSYALMSMHWIPFVVLSAWIFGFLIRNMLIKDESLSRHAYFAA